VISLEMLRNIENRGKLILSFNMHYVSLDSSLCNLYFIKNIVKVTLAYHSITKLYNYTHITWINFQVKCLYNNWCCSNI